MSSKYGFTSDEDRLLEEQRRRREEQERQREAERRRRQAHDRRRSRLSEVHQRIDRIVADVLRDFAEASPSYFVPPSPDWDHIDLARFRLAQSLPIDVEPYQFSSEVVRVQGTPAETWRMAEMLAHDDWPQPGLGADFPGSEIWTDWHWGRAQRQFLGKRPLDMFQDREPFIPGLNAPSQYHLPPLEEMVPNVRQPSPDDYYDEEAGGGFQSWIVAGVLGVTVALRRADEEPELLVTSRAPQAPDDALEHLCQVLESETGLPCARPVIRY